MDTKNLHTLLPSSKKLDLLYIEDNLLTRESFQEVFEGLFAVVHTAENANEGLEIFGKNNIDIVITDIEMPGMSGIEMARVIKAQDSNIPIIIMTGHIDHTFFLESIEVGVDAYLLKPVNEKSLFSTLHRIVKNTHACKSLYEESGYFRVLTEASIVSKANTNGIITYVNDNLCKTSGYTREELIGKSHNIFRHPNTSNALYKSLWGTILKGQVWRGRFENLNKNKKSFLADTIIIPLKDAKGKILEFIAIRQDVTELINLQRKMDKNILKKIQKKRIDEAKEQFLVLFTHELKTPLNAIINFSKYITSKLINSKYLEPEKTVKLLKSITSNANDMLDNVNNILDLSKLQSHKLSYQKRLFSLSDAINSVVEQFDLLIQTKDIKISFLTTGVDEIYSDEYRVKQIINNILSNAIKYGKDKIQIEVIKSNTAIEVYIDDNGKGIANKESIFNLYEQGSVSLITRETNGTGIGLYFVKLMCLDLKISYTLKDSEVLGGTRFGLIFDINFTDKGQ